MREGTREKLMRIRSAYRDLSVIVVNTVIVFSLLNCCAAGILTYLPDSKLHGSMKYGLERLIAVYPHRDVSEIRQLLSETWSRPYLYEPYTQFRESAFSGEFVNVDEYGFRDNGFRASWPPLDQNLAVFVFGGSTTFGYGVADTETLPARLQKDLDVLCDRVVVVYNLARSNYFSSQENILFQRLLVQGITPAAAVFIDGINEFEHPADEPKFTKKISYWFQETTLQISRRLAVGLPLARLAKRLINRPDSGGVMADPKEAQKYVDRWLKNRDQIRVAAAAAGVETLFVWQPNPYFGYDLKYHLFAKESDASKHASTLGYEHVNTLRKDPASGLGEDFLWLADLQRNQGKALYVDQVHYTAAFSNQIASQISQVLAPRLCAGGK